MEQVNSHKIGLVVGGTVAIVHVVWSLLVLLGMAKLYLDWIFGLHFLNIQYSINPFDILNALILVIVTGVIGYIVGYIFGWVWNLAHRTSHNR